MDPHNLKYEFDHAGVKYIADIRHFLDLSPEEIQLHGMTEDTYLIHLFSLSGVRTFELFIEAGDMSMSWKTKSDFIDPTLCEIIGREIDNLHL